MRQGHVGLLLQLDGSPFAWFGPTQPICSLLGAIDDATGAVLAGTTVIQRILHVARAEEPVDGHPEPRQSREG